MAKTGVEMSMNASSETGGIVILISFPLIQIMAYEILRRKKLDVAIRKRNRSMIGFGTIAGWIAYLNLLFTVSSTPRIDSQDSPSRWFYCGIFHMLNLMIPPLAVGPQLIRGINLWSMMKRTKLMLKHGETTKLRRHTFKSVSVAVVASTSMAGKGLTLDRLEEGSGDEISIHSKNDISSIESYRSPKDRALLIKRKSKMLVRFTIGILLATYATLIGIYAGVTDHDHFRETSYASCYPEPHEYPTVFSVGIIISIIVCILTFIMMIMVQNSKDDELGIRQEISRNVIYLFGSDVAILLLRYMMDSFHEWQSLLFCIQQLGLTFSMIILPCLSTGGDFIHVVVDNENHIEKSHTLDGESTGSPQQKVKASFVHVPKDQAFDKSNPIRRLSALGNTIVNRRQSQLQAKKEAMEKATNLDAGLRSLLSTKEGIEMFTEHCSREFSVENIRFWCICNEFHRAIDLLRTPSCQEESDYGECDIRVFAQDIYDNYIKVGADLQINISAMERKSIQMSLEFSNQQVVYRLKRDLFDKAQAEIFKMMSGHSYPRFLASKQNR